MSVNDLIRGSAERRGDAAAVPPAELEAAVEAEDPADPDAEPAAEVVAQEAKPDKETEKRLAQVAKEKAKLLAQHDEAKSLLARERAQLERERAELKTQADEAKRMKAEIDEWNAISPEDRWKIDYAKTEAGSKDPKYKAAAEADAERRKNATQYQALEKTVKELQETIKQRDQAAEAKEWVTDYFGKIDKAVGENTLAHKLRASDPKDYRTGIAATVKELRDENDGEWPAEAEIVERFEAKQKAQLKKYGIDPDTILKAAPKKPVPPRPGKTLDIASGTTTSVRPAGPRKPPTDKELLQGLIDSRKTSVSE